MTNLPVLTADEVAVLIYEVERTANSSVPARVSFEAKFDEPTRNPHLGWNPPSQTIRGFQVRNVGLDGEFRGLFSSGRFIHGTGYLVSDDIMDTVKVAKWVYTEAEDTVIVGCNVAHANYFHWVTQALPAMDYAVHRPGQSRQIQLALPCLNTWQEDSLRLLGLAMHNRLNIQDPRVRYEIRKAEYCEITSGCATFSASAVTRETFRRLREAVERPASRDKKVYVARTDAPTRKMQNEGGLIEEVRRRGYEVVCPGSIAFAEQVRLFRSARIVVGPHGAGLTNIVFCEPGTIVYELVPAHYANACFCNLGHNNNLRVLAGCVRERRRGTSK